MKLADEGIVDAKWCEDLNQPALRWEFAKVVMFGGGLVSVEEVGNADDTGKVAVENAVLKGQNNDPKKLDLLGKVNRAEAVTIALRVFEAIAGYPAEGSLPDLKDSDWFAEAVKRLVRAGGIKGLTVNGQRVFAGANNITRGETIALMTQFFRANEAITVWQDAGNEGAPLLANIEAVASGAVYFGDEELTAEGLAGEEVAGGEEGGEEGGETPETPATPATPGTVTGGGKLALALDSSLGPSIIPDGTAFNPIAKFTFSASGGNVNLKGLTITKTGFVGDTSVKLSIWKDGVRYGSVVQVSSDHTSVIDFSATPIAILSGKSATIVISINLVATINSGTVGVSLAGKDHVSSDAAEVTGAPVSGPNFQITDGASSVAAATFDLRSLRATAAAVDIGQKDYEISKFELAETSSREDMKLSGLTIFNNGSAADGDLTTLTLKDQDGVVLATVKTTSNKYAIFTLEKAYSVPLGTTRVLSIYIQIDNGATRTGQFVVQSDFDVVLEGSSTGAKILATTKAGGTDTSFPIGDTTTTINSITINEGNITITKDNSSPSGDITKGGNTVVLARYRVQAVGEGVRIEKAAVDLSRGTSDVGASNTTGEFDCAATATCDLTGSVRLQTQSGKTLLTISADTAALWNGNNGAAATATYADLSSFHTIAAGVTEVLEVVANVSSGTNLGAGETIRADITKLYFYKMSSFKYADSGAATGNVLTATTSSITVSSFAEYGNQTVVSGTSTVKLAAFVIKAGSAEGVNITAIGLQVDQSTIATAAATGVTNLILKKVVTDADGKLSEVQVGTTQSTVSDATTVSFSTSGLNVKASGQLVIYVYGDMSSSIGTNTLTTSVPINGISGSAIVSATSTTGPAAALTLQVITGSTGGTLRVVNGGNNPVSDLFISGTNNNTFAVVQLNASLAEEIYIKEFVVRNDANADDASLGTLSLASTTTPGGTETALGTASLIGDDANPGYATWTFSGTGRPKVPSNGTLYVNVKANIVSSQQTAVTGLTPRLSVASIKAEGVSQITPLFVAAGNATDSTANLPSDATGAEASVNDTGCAINAAAGITAAATSITIDAGTTGNCTAADIPAGVVIKIGTEQMLVTANTADITLTVTRAVNGTTAATAADNAVIYYGRPIDNAANNVFAAYSVGDASFTAAAGNFVVGQVIQLDTEDLFVHSIVIGDVAVNAGLIYVDRAVNNTTLAAHNTASGAVNEYTAVQGNAHTIANTKPTFAAATDSPSGAVLATNNAFLLAKFTVNAAANSADSALNRVSLVALDLRMTRTGVTITSMNLYPAENDLDSNFTVAGVFLSQNTLRFTLTTLTQDKDKVDEGTTRTYVLRGNVTALGANSSLRLELTNLGTAGAAGLGGTVLGAADTAPDIQYTDGVTTFFWTKQATTQVFLNAAAMTSSTAVGTVDTTGPLISTITLSNGTGANATANSVDSDIVCTSTATAPTLVCDHASIVFNEAIDPSTINASLVPSGATTGAGDTLTVLSPTAVSVAVGGTGSPTSSGGTTVLTFTGVATVTATMGAAYVQANAFFVALDSAYTTLKIYDIDTAADQTVAAPSASASLGTTVKDIHGNLLQAAATTTTASTRF